MVLTVIRVLRHDQTLERLVLPKPVSPLEMLLGPSGADARATATIQNLVNGLPTPLAAEIKQLSTLQLLAKERVLTVMPFRVVID